jgi:uncharacterized damage-inducible protein DinB
MPHDAAQLLTERERTEAAFATAIADAKGADRSYAPGKWTARQMLWHIADCESVFLDRLRRSLAEPQPLLLAFDENRWTELLGRASADLAPARDLYLASRSCIHGLVAALPPAMWERCAVHSIVGKISVEQQVTKILWHDAHHRAQVEAALAGKTWTPA